MTKTHHEQVMEAVMRYLENHQMVLVVNLDFPQYKILPPEVELALQVLNKHGMSMKMFLKDKK